MRIEAKTETKTKKSVKSNKKPKTPNVDFSSECLRIFKKNRDNVDDMPLFSPKKAF